MLAHRLRRWPIILTTMGQCLVFSETSLCTGEVVNIGSAKPKGSNCLLEKKAVTAFWLCTTDMFSVEFLFHYYIVTYM